MNRHVLAAKRRVLGAEHPDTLATAGNLAQSLSGQGLYSEAVEINRQVFEAMRRVLGAQHPDTLTAAGNLAQSLSGQGNPAEAEEIERGVLADATLVLGPEHPDTLATAGNLAQSLSCQGKYVEAEQINRDVLAVAKRVLGAEHPDSLMTANNLATFLAHQGKLAEAESMLVAVLTMRKHVLGGDHPDTLDTASSLENVRSRFHLVDHSAPSRRRPIAPARLPLSIVEMVRRPPMPVGRGLPTKRCTGTNSLADFRFQTQRLVAQPMYTSKHVSHGACLDTQLSLQGILAGRSANKLLPASASCFGLKTEDSQRSVNREDYGPGHSMSPQRQRRQVHSKRGDGAAPPGCRA